MAHRGTAPKAMKHGRTPNAEWVEVPDVLFEGPSPDLPALPRRKKWHPMVATWWEQVREMPHCRLWRPSDWTFALETAYQKQAHWELCERGEQTTTAAVEIRRREDQMGTTIEALRKLRIRYKPVDEDGEGWGEAPERDVQIVEQEVAGTSGGASVTPIASRRDRLTRSA